MTVTGQAVALDKERANANTPTWWRKRCAVGCGGPWRHKYPNVMRRVPRVEWRPQAAATRLQRPTASIGAASPAAPPGCALVAPGCGYPPPVATCADWRALAGSGGNGGWRALESIGVVGARKKLTLSWARGNDAWRAQESIGGPRRKRWPAGSGVDWRVLTETVAGRAWSRLAGSALQKKFPQAGTRGNGSWWAL